MPNATQAIPLDCRLWRGTVERKEGNSVVLTGSLTKLPSIRGLSFASRRPAGVGLAGTASNHVPYVSLPFAPKAVLLNMLSVRHTSKCWRRHSWRQVFGGDTREVKRVMDTYRGTLVVPTILLGRIALLRRVATAVTRSENMSVSMFL